MTEYVGVDCTFFCEGCGEIFTVVMAQDNIPKHAFCEKCKSWLGSLAKVKRKDHISD